MYDVIIVGGGPAGLSAALVLGRARRRVLVCEDGKHRNDAAPGVHAFLTRDGIHPSELRRLAREQLAPYGVEYRIATVREAESTDSGFALTLDTGERLESRKLLLATGVVDEIPEIEGMRRYFGCGVFHCPYCDGWEVRDQPLVAFGRGQNAAGLALSLKTWSEHVAICTNGPSGLNAEALGELERNGIRLEVRKIERLEGSETQLERIVFAEGEPLAARGIFLSTGQHQRCDLAGNLGCKFTRKGAVRTGRLEQTGVPGLWVAGDASKDVQLAIVAAAEGAKAGIAINTALQQESYR